MLYVAMSIFRRSEHEKIIPTSYFNVNFCWGDSLRSLYTTRCVYPYSLIDESDCTFNWIRRVDMKSRKTNWTNNNAPLSKQNCRTKTNKSIGSTVFNELKTFRRFSRL